MDLAPFGLVARARRDLAARARRDSEALLRSYPAPVWWQAPLKTRLIFAGQLVGYGRALFPDMGEEVGQLSCVEFACAMIALL